MCRRLTVIKKYYINLGYIQINKADAISKISALTEQISKKTFRVVPERFYNMISIIKENWSFFASFCKHIDIITTFVHCLTDFGERLDVDCNNRIITVEVLTEIMILLYLTFYNVWPEIQSFLNAMLALLLGDTYNSMFLNGQINEMIILEDSDLDAVISCLKIIEKKALTKIWIQEQIKEKFLWFTMKYFCDSNFPIYTFRSKRELLTSNKYNKISISIVSIWSENITSAKSLAKSLNKTILFINTHMDFRDSSVLIPYVKILTSIHTASAILNRDFISKSSNDKIDATQASKMFSTPIYNLFYDGKWQMSTSTTYCKYDNSLWANATNKDIQKCVYSAQKGFEIWSAKPIHLKKELLHNVINVLECSGYGKLKSFLSLLISSFYRFNKFYTYVTKKGLEITDENVPLGIIILKEEREDVFFTRLFNILLSGNSVIIIHNANFYNFCPYIDIFTMYGIPPGVINVLSSNNIESLELYLCKAQYSRYAQHIYSSFNTCPGYPIQSKKIILPLK